ncbi:hypothetical protein MHZ93_04670 [Roseomonas sp. ACRSG]|nr:hypothetical protein [Roseomonas sp. ACRSG]
MLDAAREHRLDLKALFITGYNEDAVLSQGSLDRHTQIMLKPFSLEALMVRVEELLGKR